MKIFQVVHGFPPYNFAGTEVYTYNLSQELAKRHKVFVFHRINDLCKKEYLVEHRTLNSCDVFTINNTFRQCSSFEMTYRNATIAEKFGLILDQVNPDIVHIQHLLYLSTKIIEQIKKRNLPIVFTLHDYLLICPQGQLLKNDLSICSHRKYTYECLGCIFHHLSIKKYVFGIYYLLEKYSFGFLTQPFKKIYLSFSKRCLSKEKIIKLIEERYYFIKNICATIDLFIAPSQFLKERFVEFGIPKNKITQLNYGFNTGIFKRFNKAPCNSLRFGFIGNIMPAKGLHVLIQCFNKIKTDFIELKIYGQQNSYKGALGEYLKNIRKIVKNRNIRFMGGFDNKNIADIFTNIDVLIVPSIWPENSPLVISEAFLAKTPVIASRIGGIPELVKDGINGLLFDPGNADDLCEKLQYLIDNPDIIKKFKDNMPEVKSIEENTKEMEEIYVKLIAGSKL